MKIRHLISVLTVLSLSLTSACSNTPDSTVIENLPIRIKDSQFKPLSFNPESKLQKILEKKMSSNPEWMKLIKNNKMAVGLVDMRDLNQVEFASMNPDVMMYAASLPKIAVLLGAMDAFEKGVLEEKTEYLADLKLMIARSDNAAATRMIDRLGYDYINGVLMDPEYMLYNEKMGGGLWVGKRYAKTGTRQGDPLKGLSHAATVDQVSRFYYLMALGRLVNYDRSSQMLDIMIDPELHHKFVYSTDRVAPNAHIYRKSGTWQNFHADSMLVWGNTWRRYILVALIDDPKGESICRQLVLTAEDALREFRRVPGE